MGKAVYFTDAGFHGWAQWSLRKQSGEALNDANQYAGFFNQDFFAAKLPVLQK